MYLTDEEKRMMDGEYGYGAQLGMKIEPGSRARGYAK